MDSKKDLSFEEKIRAVEAGQMTAEEASKDPNTTLAFTSFVGADPGAKPGDADYKSGAQGPKGGKKKATKTGTTTTTPKTAASSTPKTTKTMPPRSSPVAGPSTSSKGTEKTFGFHATPWFQDEEDFALEKLAENEGITWQELADAVNTEFAPIPYTENDVTYNRGNRTKESCRQRFKPWKAELQARLDKETDQSAPSLGWRNTK